MAGGLAAHRAQPHGADAAETGYRVTEADQEAAGKKVGIFLTQRQCPLAKETDRKLRNLSLTAEKKT